MNDNFLEYLNMNINTIFSFQPVTNQQLKDIVLSFKNTSAGFDGLPMKVFKDNIDIAIMWIYQYDDCNGNMFV